MNYSSFSSHTEQMCHCLFLDFKPSVMVLEFFWTFFVVVFNVHLLGEGGLASFLF